jgi:hypothetical protein
MDDRNAYTLNAVQFQCNLSVCTATLMHFRGTPTTHTVRVLLRNFFRRSHCTFIKTPNDTVCFEHAHSAHSFSDAMTLLVFVRRLAWLLELSRNCLGHYENIELM